MTLFELSRSYSASAAALRTRIRELRDLEEDQTDPAVLQELQRRIHDLSPLLRETRELAKLTAHYYDRSCHKDERYTF